MSRPTVFFFELAIAGMVLALSGSASARDNEPMPKISIDPASVVVGDKVTVQFDGWPQGAVAVGVCGNQALRGTEDCAVLGDEALTINSSKPRLVQLAVQAPPVPCPCVIRASTPDSNVVATAALQIRGFAVGPSIAPPGPAQSAQLGVDAKVKGAGGGLLTSAAAAFGGPVKRELVLTLRNRGLTPLTGLRTVAEVGRDAHSGAPIATRTVRTLAPNAAVTVKIPIHIDAPTYGSYTVHGTVYGLAAPVTFHTETDADPWAVELLLPIALVIIAEILRKKERDRRRAEERASMATLAAEPIVLEPASTNGNGHGTYEEPVTIELSIPEPTSATAAGGGQR